MELTHEERRIILDALADRRSAKYETMRACARTTPNLTLADFGIDKISALIEKVAA